MEKTNYAKHYIAGEALCLLPERAIFWERRKSLFIADLHLGKSGHFRKAGIAVSSLIHHHDLERLSGIITEWKVACVYLLGDLFHSNHNSEWKHFTDWRMQHPEVEIHLIKGNHDILDDSMICSGKMVVHDTSYILEPFFLSHQTVNMPPGNYYQFNGHIHPGARLHGKGLQSLTFPCYFFGKTGAILPSFGGFTGHVVLHPSGDDAVFIIYNNSVKQMPGLVRQ